MNAMTWTRDHLPHPHLHRRQAEQHAPMSRAELRRRVVALVLGTYALVLLLLALLGGTVFGMTARESWGFAFGVGSYMLFFGVVLGAMIWAVAHNAMDDPTRV